jgi:hypothetical protein
MHKELFLVFMHSNLGSYNLRQDNSHCRHWLKVAVLSHILDFDLYILAVSEWSMILINVSDISFINKFVCLTR